VFVPVVDGTFITERPSITLDRQVVNGVCLIGIVLFVVSFICTYSLQDVLLSVTNTFEGRGFALPTEANTTDFVRQLFPYFSAKQTNEAASYYTALNATIPKASDQAVAVMGECSHVPLIIYKGSHC
jgi:hypothetical protein